MFKGQNYLVKTEPKNGDAVVARGRLTFYGKGGDAQMVVEQFTLQFSSLAVAPAEPAAGDPAVPPARDAERERAAADTAGCPVPPPDGAPDQVSTVLATAQLPAGPVLVMADPTGRPGSRLLVMDAATCTVLVETLR